MTRGAIRVRNRPHQSAIESASVENKQVSDLRGYPLRCLWSTHAATNDCLGSCAEGLSRATAASRVLRQQPQAPEARVTLAADHEVVVDGNAQRLGRRLDVARHLDVVARRLGIA
jgi:hypothetical protein